MFGAHEGNVIILAQWGVSVGHSWFRRDLVASVKDQLRQTDVCRNSIIFTWTTVTL